MELFNSISDKDEMDILATIGFTFKKSTRMRRNRFDIMIDNGTIEIEFKDIQSIVDFTERHGQIKLHHREITL